MTRSVADVYAELPDRARDLRDLVLMAADAAGLPAPEETLKWGELAFLPGKSGTTVRIGPDHTCGGLKLLVHCQTDLVERWRQRLDGRLQFEGNRAVLVPADGPLDRDALTSCIAEAFTYKRKPPHG